MRALTVTFHGETPGIETGFNLDGQRVINLGIPKYLDKPQPYVTLNQENPPEVNESGRLIDGKLVPVCYPDYKTGFLGHTVTRDQGKSVGNLLLRVCTKDRLNSGVSTVGHSKGKIEVRGTGYADLEHRDTTAWGDVLHTLVPGKALELIKHKPEPGMHRGNVIVNIGDKLMYFTKSQYSELGKSRQSARSYIRRVIDEDGSISPNARHYHVEAALAALLDDPTIMYLRSPTQ